MALSIALKKGDTVTYRGKQVKVDQVILDRHNFEPKKQEDLEDKDIKGVRVILDLGRDPETDQRITKHVELEDISY